MSLILPLFLLGSRVTVTVYVFVVPFPAVTTIGIGFGPTSRGIGPNTDPEAANIPLIVNVAVEFATFDDTIAFQPLQIRRRIGVIVGDHCIAVATGNPMI